MHLISTKGHVVFYTNTNGKSPKKKKFNKIYMNLFNYGTIKKKIQYFYLLIFEDYKNPLIKIFFFSYKISSVNITIIISK